MIENKVLKRELELTNNPDFTVSSFQQLKYCPYGNCKTFQVNNTVFLRSYRTLVAFYDKDTHQFYIDGLYSTTTRRHINAFLLEYAGIRSFVPYKKYVGKALVNCYTNEIEEIKGVN